MIYHLVRSAHTKHACLALFLALALFLWAGCSTVTVAPTATPTRTPRPTFTLTPTTTPVPSPTPTPAFPVSIGCADSVPSDACDRLEALVMQETEYFVWIGNQDAEVALGIQSMADHTTIGEWVYAVVAPFFTVDDDLASEDLRATWSGTPTGPFELHPLLVTADTVEVFSGLWGAPDEAMVRQIATDQLLAEAEVTDSWALVPFHILEPQWKVLRLDGLSPVDKGLDLDAYPLHVALSLGSAMRSEVLSLLEIPPQFLSNREESQMTRVVMTGVTAMTRGTAQLMDRKGNTYPAQDIITWFEDADFVHISNEVSFKPDCVAEGGGTMSFCSHDTYIELLEAVHTNIVELTGNHLEDKGAQWVDYSLDMYRERGWRWFGGGANQIAGSRPLTLTHNGNRIAFVGCNNVGPFAGEDSGGAARCDWPVIQQTISELRQQGYQPIATVQYLEDYNYAPTAPQIRDFRSLAEAGAVMVQGSQAHQAQTMEFYSGAFVHYGLGNFFFDQMWSDGTRQEFVDRLTFYQGRLLNVDLRTAILEEYGRPRPMTVGDPDPAADRHAFLQMIFDLSPQP